ncbi:elongation factor G [Mytilus galloprovincialis]|uniref:Elongation factor G n=2 Tax=Mytilus galloprovincialis TaxID=29158 RepID=A0A8B6GFE8_MYTGA|nr:elongation factor G [Mytilus galloprovincialis]
MMYRRNCLHKLTCFFKHFKRLKSSSTKTGLKDEPMQNIRNIGIMAHINAGKTTTSERMLFYSGFTRHIGNVDDGDTVMDYMEQERNRGMTISSAAITLHWKKHKINLIDTPGHVDFTVEVERSLRVLDGAVTIIDASAGVEAQTLTVWSQANRYKVPSIVFLNKMDKPKADVEKCLKSIQDKLKIKPLLVNFPILDGNRVTDIIDIIKMQKITYDFERSSEGQMFRIEDLDSKSDPELWEIASKFRNNLIGSLSDYCENIADRVITDSAITAEDIDLALRNATISRHIVPVLCGSSLKNAGVQPLIDAVTHYLPSPLEKTMDLVQFYETDLCAYAFKIIHDKHRGPLTFLRLYSGVMNLGEIYNANKNIREKPSRLIQVYSNEYHDVNTATAGNIICVAGLKKTQTGDTLTASKATAEMAAKNLHHHRKLQGLTEHDPDEIPVLGGINIHPPVFLCSVESESPSVQRKLDLALECLKREDPSLTVQVDEETGQTILGGMGELHLDIIRQRLLTEYKLDVYMGPLQVAYRETCEGESSWEETMDTVINNVKQHVVLGMSIHFSLQEKEFKHVKLVQSRENTLEKLHRNQLKAIEIGIKSAFSSGPILNFPVIDVEVELYKAEIERSTTEAMITACSSQCVHKALKEAKAVLLEPMMKMEVTVDEDNLHAVMADLGKRRSHIENVDSEEDIKLVHAITPLSETLGFSTVLRSNTHGMANFTMEFSHYEKMSEIEQQKAVDKALGIF